MNTRRTSLRSEAAKTPPPDISRQQSLNRLGIFCGFAAALWLAGAEAPTKLVTIAISPFVISFMMVFGAFISRWSLPALIRGTSDIFQDVQHVPHLVLWGVMAGCLWAVGNTLTIFAVHDIGVSLAFPLWNSNSLIDILWGTLLGTVAKIEKQQFCTSTKRRIPPFLQS
jgi:drug/metabolite transporter (DMT)-like permease